jgi:hypothetical protein
MRAHASVLFTAAKGILVDSWYARTAEDAASIYEVGRNLSLEQWVQVGSLANSSLLALVNIHQLYQIVASSHLPDERVIHLVMQQRDSAVTFYKRASESFGEGNYGKALGDINTALSEFTKTPLHKYNIAEMKADEALQAEMLQLKAVAQLLQAHTQRQITAVTKILQQALKLDSHLVVANNLLAFIYIHLLKSDESAKGYLQNSLNLCQQQLFARYYSAKIHNNEKEMHRSMKELVILFQDKQLSDEAKFNTRTDWRNLQSTTLPFMVTYMLTDWLEYSAKYADKPETLATVANVCANIAWSQPDEIVKKCSIMILETRIRALRRISKMKALATEFEPYDLEWRASHSLPTIDASDTYEKKYLMRFPASQIDHSILRLVTSQNVDLKFLTQEDYAPRLAKLIKSWIQHGFLFDDQNPLIDNIKVQIKLCKHFTGKQRIDAEAAILNLCNDKALLEYFDHTYVLSADNETLCRTFIIDNQPLSLFHLICEFANIELHVYQPDEDGYRLVHSVSNPLSISLQGPNLDTKTGLGKCIHVVYDQEHSTLAFLSNLDTPARVYRRIAASHCWSLLEKDPSNKLARDILTRDGNIVLPSLPMPEAANDNPAFDFNPLAGGVTSIQANQVFLKGEEIEKAIREQADWDHSLIGRAYTLFQSPKFYASLILIASGVAQIHRALKK